MKLFLAAMAILFGVWWLAPKYTGQFIVGYFVIGSVYFLLKREPKPAAPQITTQPRDSAGRGAPPSVDLRPATPDFIEKWAGKGGQTAQHDAEGGK